MDQTLARDAMLDRMRRASPGGPLFSTEPLPARVFDEAQSYGKSMRAVVSHPVLVAKLAVLAVSIRAALERGEVVVVKAGDELLARLEPEP